MRFAKAHTALDLRAGRVMMRSSTSLWLDTLSERAGRDRAAGFQRIADGRPREKAASEWPALARRAPAGPCRIHTM